MLPANLAKSRAAGARGLGELLMVSPHTGSGMLQTLRYSPYSVPVSTNTAMVAALSQQPLSLTNHSTAAAVSGTSPLQAALAAAQAAVAAGQQQSAGHNATHGLHHAASAAHQLPQLQLIGLDSNGQLSSLSQLLSAAAASGQFAAAAANHHGCKVATSLSVPTTLSSSQAAICYSNPFTNALVASGQQGQASGAGRLGSGAGTPTSGHAHPHQLHHSHHHQAHNLGYNVSDLLNLQGLQGLQVPVGL